MFTNDAVSQFLNNAAFKQPVVNFVFAWFDEPKAIHNAKKDIAISIHCEDECFLVIVIRVMARNPDKTWSPSTQKWHSQLLGEAVKTSKDWKVLLSPEVLNQNLRVEVALSSTTNCTKVSFNPHCLANWCTSIAFWVMHPGGSDVNDKYAQLLVREQAKNDNGSRACSLVDIYNMVAQNSSAALEPRIIALCELLKRKIAQDLGNLNTQKLERLSELMKQILGHRGVIQDISNRIARALCTLATKEALNLAVVYDNFMTQHGLKQHELEEEPKDKKPAQSTKFLNGSSIFT